MYFIREEIIKKNIIKLLKTNELILVVKDNAYGFGIKRIVKLASELGISSFAVKSVSEAREVRVLNSTAQILVLGKIFKKDIQEIKAYKLVPTLNDYDDYLLFKKNQIACHLAIDTGMNRFGMKSGYLAIINDHLVKAIYTHLYQPKNDEKIAFMERLAKKYSKSIHLGGSLAYGKTKETIRVGKMIYENSLYFYGNIVNIKKVLKDETVGYDGLFLAPKDCLIGVCNVGYSDGLELLFHGNVCINNFFYQCVGRCCMDQCFILIDENVKLNDEVEFFGKQISEEEFIKNNHMTKYEMFLQINR